MRFAISVASQLGRRHKVAEICHFVRGCSASWEPLTPYIRGLANKQHVTNESLKKIENAAYAIAIRRIECGDIELQDILLDFTRDRDDGVGEGDRAARKRGMDTETGDDCDDNTDYF